MAEVELSWKTKELLERFLAVQVAQADALENIAGLLGGIRIEVGELDSSISNVIEIAQQKGIL